MCSVHFLEKLLAILFINLFVYQWISAWQTAFIFWSYWIKNKIVYIFGLSGDYKREKFGQVLDLIPLADNITQLKSICNNCKLVKDAPFTLRITDKKNQVSVGGKNEYIAVCRDCWLNTNN